MASPPASSAAPVAPAVATDRAAYRARARARSRAQAQALPQAWDASLYELPRKLHRASVVAGVLILASMIATTLIAAHLAAHTLIYPQPVIQVSLANPANPGAANHPGDTLTFDVRATAGRQLTYTWEFGDGSGSTGVKGTRVAHAYGTYGYYAVTCEAVDLTGQRGGAQLTVTIVPPSPQAKVAVKHDRAYDYMVTVDGSGSTGVDLHYYWDFGDGASIGSGLDQQATHYYQHPGVFGLTLTVVDVAGQSSVAAVQVTVSATAFH
jgi:hypothetical protein